MTQGVAGDTASRRASRAEALLSVHRVSASRTGEGGLVPVLADVSLDVSSGEFVVIVGGRRSGKTALLRVCAGMEAPQRGVVRIRGRRITGVSGGARARRAREVGYMPKELQLAAGRRVVDHILLPLLAGGVPLSAATSLAYEALDRVEAMDLAAAMPQELTPGQQALVALARALVRRPALLLADEPGAKAEPDDRDRILRLLRSLASENADLGVVLTARDTAGGTGATRVLSLSDGRLTRAVPRGQVVPLPVR